MCTVTQKEGNFTEARRDAVKSIAQWVFPFYFHFLSEDPGHERSLSLFSFVFSLLAFIHISVNGTARINTVNWLPEGPEWHVLISDFIWHISSCLILTVLSYSRPFYFIYCAILTHFFLFRVCTKAGVCAEGSPDSFVCSQNIADVYSVLLNSLNDYTSDSRGDVGAWWGRLSFINAYLKMTKSTQAFSCLRPLVFLCDPHRSRTPCYCHM